MPESVTYYHRDGKDYAVFAYNLLELYEMTVREGDQTPKDVWEAIRHLEGRQRRGWVQPLTRGMDPDEEDPDAIQP